MGYKIMAPNFIDKPWKITLWIIGFSYGLYFPINMILNYFWHNLKNDPNIYLKIGLLKDIAFIVGVILVGFIYFNVINKKFNTKDIEFYWYIIVYASDGTTISSPSTYERIAPTINIYSPINSYSYLENSKIIDLNVTAQDNNLDSCWYNYNGINTSVTCNLNTTFNYVTGSNILTYYSNNSAGNIASIVKNMNVLLSKESQSYTSSILEGGTSTFKANFYTNGTDINFVRLNYDGTGYTTSLSKNGNNFTISKEMVALLVSSDTNNSWYWNVSQDGTYTSTNPLNQTVLNLRIDNCGTNLHLLINLSLKNEGDKTPLNGTIETNLDIITDTNYAQVLNFSQKVIGKYSSICSNILLNETNFLLNAEIRYSSTNHSAEFYHIQRAKLTDYPINLSLFDLSSDDTTIFKVLYRNVNLVGVEGAILQLQRKYLSENTYEIVEAPITSSDSSGIVHIDTNSNKYQITVVKNGEVLGIFKNLAFICQSELTGECILDLFDKLNPPNIIPITSLQDFSYSIDTSIDNQTITLTYTIPSGTSKTINIVAKQIDPILGTSTICNKTLISSAGSVECSYNTTIQDSKIDFKVYQNGELIVQRSYVVQEDLRNDWGGVNYIILIILLLSLVFMALSSPEWVVINAVITVLIGGGIWLIRGVNFVQGLGSVMWLVIGAVILITKLAKQEDF